MKELLKKKNNPNNFFPFLIFCIFESTDISRNENFFYRYRPIFDEFEN